MELVPIMAFILTWTYPDIGSLPTELQGKCWSMAKGPSIISCVNKKVMLLTGLKKRYAYIQRNAISLKTSFELWAANDMTWPVSFWLRPPIRPGHIQPTFALHWTDTGRLLQRKLPTAFGPSGVDLTPRISVSLWAKRIPLAALYTYIRSAIYPGV